MFITEDLKLSDGCIYMLSSKHQNILYIGVTSNIFQRIEEHQTKKHKKNVALHRPLWDPREHIGKNGGNPDRCLERFGGLFLPTVRETGKPKSSVHIFLFRKQ